MRRQSRAVRSIGYARGAAPLGFAEDAEEVWIDADSARAASVESDLSGG
jgi:hypothetical protein